MWCPVSGSNRVNRGGNWNNKRNNNWNNCRSANRNRNNPDNRRNNLGFRLVSTIRRPRKWQGRMVPSTVSRVPLSRRVQSAPSVGLAPHFAIRGGRNRTKPEARPSVSFGRERQAQNCRASHAFSHLIVL